MNDGKKMKIMARLIWSMTLLAILSVVSPIAASNLLPLPYICCGQTQPSIAYDGTSVLCYDYDYTSTLLATEEQGWNSRTSRTSDSFADFVKAIAAKTAPNPLTGRGYGVTDSPVRIQGTWTEADFKAALQGRPPPSLGRPDLHHAGQMPGSAIHEVLPGVHRGNPALHPNRFNQGVTPQMRNQDRQLHWWYRAREQGADRLYPDLIYDP